jgi:hypothetical protein
MAQFNEERKDSKEQPVSPRVGFEMGICQWETPDFTVKFERTTNSSERREL